MKYIYLMAACSLFLFNSTNIRAGHHDPIQTVPYVEVERYMGTWYEIAKYPNRFQRKCGAAKATYVLKKRYVKVINECKRLSNPEKIKKAKGVAFIKDKETNAKLRVGFAPLFKYLGLFAGDYWIMELGADYEYVLVGTPDLKYLWILSRTPTLPAVTVEELLDTAEDNGFDRSKVAMTPVWEM